MIYVVAMGDKMPAWVQVGFQEYQKRLLKGYQLTLIEIPLKKRAQAGEIPRLMAQEGELMLAKIPPQAFVVTLEIKAPMWSTEQFSEQLTHWQAHGQAIYFLIGGPEGLAPQCLARANARWSLSPLTLPHPVVRLVLVEQIYRAYTLSTGHPYHK